MYFILNNLETLIYGFTFSLLILAIKIFSSQTGSHYGFQLRQIHQNERILKAKINLANYLYSANADKLFKEAGYPLRLTGLKYSLYRVILLSGFCIFFILKWLSQGPPFPWSKIVFFIALYLLTSVGNWSPLSLMLKKLKIIYNRDKNRECFLLYSMLLNEFNIQDDRPHNLYSMLQKLSAYFDKIKPVIYKTLALWKRNPDLALDVFASEIGTPEASDLSQILKTLDAASPSEAKDIIRSRYEQFQTSRHEHHRRTLKNIDLIGYVIVFIPTLAILFNMVFVLGIAVQGLLQSLNAH